MTNDLQRHYPIEGTHNFRDAGGYATRDGRSVRWRTLFRSDSLHDLSDAAKQEVHDLGVRTSIDLRSPSETAHRPSVFASGGPVAYMELPLAVSGSDPRAPRAHDLPDLNRRFLDQGQSSFAAIFGALAAKPTFPIVVNCTAGKDRTGIVVAMLLALAGVHHDDIVEDYALTAKHGEVLLKRIYAEATASGRDPEQFARLMQCEPDTMAGSLAHLDREHGGAERYIRSVGLDDAAVASLRDALVEG